MISGDAAPSWPRILIGRAAIGVDRRLINAAERCARPPPAYGLRAVLCRRAILLPRSADADGAVTPSFIAADLDPEAVSIESHPGSRLVTSAGSDPELPGY
jgi:hypothetical protein